MAEPTDAQVIDLDPRRRAAGTPRCTATTAAGRPCRNHAGPSGLCRIHAPDEAGPAPEERVGGGERGLDRDRVLAEVLGFIRRRLTGDYEVDVYGFDRELTEQVLMPIARPLYRRYWRVRTVGMEHIPSQGGALVVSNHSGTLPFDAIMTKLAVLDDHPAHRHLRELAADLALRVPVIGPLARKTGSTLAHGEDARRLLASGELVGVWPEGFKGVGKHFRDRYKLQRFGRGGFVEVALRAQVPIVPVAVVGAEEIYPLLADFRLLARLFGFPYFPITAQFPLLGPLGALPLPTKWVIEIGAPIDTTQYGPEEADDPMLVFELTDRIRDTIQQMLYRMLMGRRSIFF